MNMDGATIGLFPVGLLLSVSWVYSCNSYLYNYIHTVCLQFHKDQSIDLGIYAKAPRIRRWSRGPRVSRQRVFLRHCKWVRIILKCKRKLDIFPDNSVSSPTLTLSWSRAIRFGGSRLSTTSCTRSSFSERSIVLTIPLNFVRLWNILCIINSPFRNGMHIMTLAPERVSEFLRLIKVFPSTVWALTSFSILAYSACFLILKKACFCRLYHILLGYMELSSGFLLISHEDIYVYVPLIPGRCTQTLLMPIVVWSIFLYRTVTSWSRLSARWQSRTDSASSLAGQQVGSNNKIIYYVVID